MQNLWIKRCKCGKTAIEFRSRKDLYVDSIRHTYCPKCVKEAVAGTLMLKVKKWGSSTSKDSDIGLYGILYNPDAVQRRNKKIKWDDKKILEVFETGMVTPNLLSILRENIDYTVFGVLQEGENPLDYKHKEIKNDNKSEKAITSDGVLYDTTMEEPLDHLAGKIKMFSQEEGAKKEVLKEELEDLTDSIIEEPIGEILDKEADSSIVAPETKLISVEDLSKEEKVSDKESVDTSPPVSPVK